MQKAWLPSSFSRSIYSSIELASLWDGMLCVAIRTWTLGGGGGCIRHISEIRTQGSTPISPFIFQLAGCPLQADLGVNNLGSVMPPIIQKGGGLNQPSTQRLCAEVGKGIQLARTARVVCLRSHGGLMATLASYL